MPMAAPMPMAPPPGFSGAMGGGFHGGGGAPPFLSAAPPPPPAHAQAPPPVSSAGSDRTGGGGGGGGNANASANANANANANAVNSVIPALLLPQNPISAVFQKHLRVLNGSEPAASGARAGAQPSHTKRLSAANRLRALILDPTHAHYFKRSVPPPPLSLSSTRPSPPLVLCPSLSVC
jgi:hypothetical protein